jgi:hypothetical protein
MAKDVNNIIYKVQVDATSGKISIDGVTKSFEQADKAFLKLQKDVAKGIPNATKNVKNLGDATGSATSATMELSRVISDAPYGIRGMANNITQLVSQLGTASTKAGGFGAALKLMGKQLMGPLGIVFAITAVVSAMDYFFGANKKAEDSANKASESIGGQATKLLALKDALEDSSMSREEANEAVEAANKEFKELNLKLDKNNKLTDDSVIAINNKIEALINLSKAQALQSLLEQKYSELLPLQSKQTELDTKAKEDNAKALKAISVSYKEHGTALAESSASSSQAASDSNREAVKKIEKDISDLLKLGGEDGIIDLMFKGTKGRKGTKKKLSPFKTPEELELDVKSNLLAIDKLTKQTELIRLKSEEKERLSMAQSEEDKSFIKKDYANRRLDIDEKYEKKAMESRKLAEIKSATESNIAYQRKIDKDLIAFEAKLRKEKKVLTDAESKMLQDAKKVASDKKANANQELMDTVVDIESQYSKLFPFWEQMAAARRAAIGTDEKIDKEEGNEFTLEDALASYMELQQGLTNFMSGEFDRQITLEQNKTNALNNELRERLNGENLSKSERKRIQLEIARNDEALRKKQEVIEKKRFKMQKAANISQAVISTYLAANQVLVETKGGTVARFVAMAATISAGLLNVAAISRQKFQSSAGATSTAGALGGGGSGGGNDRSFNFNLAGASQENQLAQTLQGRFNQPLQAYVVSRDITNQQQLDEEITSSASFG